MEVNQVFTQREIDRLINAGYRVESGSVSYAFAFKKHNNSVYTISRGDNSLITARYSNNIDIPTTENFSTIEKALEYLSLF